MNEKAKEWFGAMIIITAIGTYIWGCIKLDAHWQEGTKIKQFVTEAVERGYAERVTDHNGNESWRWKPKWTFSP